MRFTVMTGAIAIAMGAIAYAACGGRLLVAECPDAGHVCGQADQELWCCPSYASCGDAGRSCFAPPRPEAAPADTDPWDTDPWDVEPPPPHGGASSSGGSGSPMPRAQ